MRIERDTLIDLALKALAEQVEQARTSAPPPSHGVRLALAVLHGFSDGGREPFVSFWQQMLRDERAMPTETIANYCRATYLQTQLRGVMRAVGIEATVAAEQHLSGAALRVFPRRSKERPV